MTRDSDPERRAEAERGRVLAVDDNRLNRMTLEKTLTLEGHDVRLAETGSEALDLLVREPFDLVLLDIVMPEMDGYAVLDFMKRDPRMRDIPVIVISGLDDIDSAVRCIEMGAEDYLSKPFNAVLLRARLNASLQRKKLRDLEKTYLQQEVTLRQNERLATLGKLSAGMAHELNNPASAAKRGAEQLADALASLEEAYRGVGTLPPDLERDALLERMSSAAATEAHESDALGPLAMADRTAAIEALLETGGVPDAWHVAPMLADAGFSEAQIGELVSQLPSEQLGPILTWLSASTLSRGLLDEIVTSTGQITELVGALKGYTYLDQAPVQEVDVHEGINSTLVILRSKLAKGIRVERSFAAGLPRIPAYGSELNQVWTNLVDNAIDAMDGQGDLRLSTRIEDGWVVVGVEDSGPGIPSDVRTRLFDPFFTTKPPGSGTGLGLNISHSIVVEKHLGRIEVDSSPGRTRFDVWLPLTRDDTSSDQAGIPQERAGGHSPSGGERNG